MLMVLGIAAEFGRFAFAATTDPPVPAYHPPTISPELQQDFLKKGFKLDAQSGNYLGPRLSVKTVHEPLAPVLIDGRYVKDLRGQIVFLRQSIRDKVLAADVAMFKKKKQHLKVNYGFRPNALQYELYQKLNGHAKVAPAGMSFHETGMAVDLGNWRDAQGFMIDAGFVGGCFGLEEDMVHYSINEINKASNGEAFKRCTFHEIPEDVLKAAKKAGIESEKVVEKVGDIITFGHMPGKKTTQ
jgi:hypothetical protein